MVKNIKNQITLDDLAGMVKRGFDAVDARFSAVDARFSAVDGRFNKAEQVQKDILEELTATHADVHYLKTTVDKLTHSDIAHDVAIQGLTTRVRRLEQRAGLAK